MCCGWRPTGCPTPTSPPGYTSLKAPVRNYLSTAISKLGTRNRIEAARVARDRGWL